MRVLVTGASGFIGSHVTQHLLALGHEAIATGRDGGRLAHLADGRCQKVVADLALDDLDPLVNSCRAVVHCAARASPWGERSLFWRDNVVATERLIDAAQRGGSIRRFVLVSSPSIYFRPCDQLQLTEAFTPPKYWPTFYAETKWRAERRVLAAPELGPVVLRPRAVFGPGDNAIMPRLIAVAQSGLFPLPGGGAALTDVTYVDNVVSAIALALDDHRDVVGQVFNISNGEPLRVRDLLTRIFAALNLRTRLLSCPRSVALGLASLSESIARLRPGRPEPRLTRYGVGLLSYSQTLSIDAARRLLGYTTAVSIDEGIERYARWWLAR